MKSRAILIALAGGAGLLLVGLFLARDRTPALTRAALDEARALWARSGVSGYDIDLRVDVDRLSPQRYRLEVREGRVSRFEQNGLVAQGSGGSSGEEYTVPGLFGVIEREMELAAGPPVEGAPVGASLRARFDPENGLPSVFKRIAPKGQSTFIQVERFTPRP